MKRSTDPAAAARLRPMLRVGSVGLRALPYAAITAVGTAPIGIAMATCAAASWAIAPELSRHSA